MSLIHSNIKKCVFAVQWKDCYKYSLLFTLKLDKLTSGFAHKLYFQIVKMNVIVFVAVVLFPSDFSLNLCFSFTVQL